MNTREHYSTDICTYIHLEWKAQTPSSRDWRRQPHDSHCTTGLVKPLQDDESRARQGLSDTTEETHSMYSPVLLRSVTGCSVGMHGAKKTKKLTALKKGDYKMNDYS